MRTLALIMVTFSLGAAALTGHTTEKVESTLKVIPLSYTKKKPVTIAVVDTGFGFEGKGVSAKLCKYGHKDFTVDQKTVPFDTVSPVPLDLNSHGTNVVGLISKQLEESKVPYCLVILKYFSDNQTGRQNLDAEVEALKYATSIKATVINLSGGGPEWDENEHDAVKKYIAAGGLFVTAAGNERANIDEEKNFYYPANYAIKGIVVVGNMDDKGFRVPSSDYGKTVTVWENGLNQDAYGIKMTGTSQATAVATGKIVAKAKLKNGR